jgi:putative NADH-flavin reductase
MEHLQAYKSLQDSKLDWTFVCSPDIKDEVSTGNYTTNKDYPPKPNHNRIAAGDLAAFMLAAAEKNEYLKCRVGISN